MPGSTMPFDAMAADMGVLRHYGEDDFGFCSRVAYSCVRPWVWSFCMDDGADGSAGVSKQAINARLKRWLSALETLRPGMNEWFGVPEGKAALVYNRLIDIDDISEASPGGRYVAHRPHFVQLTDAIAVVVGAIEASGISGYVTTGLCSLAAHEGELPSAPPPFWETEAELLTWSKESDVGDVEYVNLSSRRWGLRAAESWQSGAEWADGMSLARLVGGRTVPDRYYIARRSRGPVLLSEIGWDRAAELWLFLRSATGNGICGRTRMLDEHHATIEGVPLAMLSGTYGRYFDALSWPVSNVGDSTRRTIRAEAVPAVRELLALCQVDLREV